MAKKAGAATPRIKRTKGMMAIVEVVSSQSTINAQEAVHAGHRHH
jgi:hypothetical protein